MTAPLHELIYVSQFSPDTDAASIQHILQQAGRHNREHGLTGALLAYAGHFLQVLEGAQAEIDALFERISADGRHHHIVTVSSGPIAERRFGRWAMRHVPPPAGHDRTVIAFLKELGARPEAHGAVTALALLKRLSAN